MVVAGRKGGVGGHCRVGERERRRGRAHESLVRETASMKREGMDGLAFTKAQLFFPGRKYMNDKFC